jgi:hypothetical protein
MLRISGEMAEYLKTLSSVFSDHPGCLEWTINEILTLYKEDADAGKHYAALRIFTTAGYEEMDRLKELSARVRQFDELPGKIRMMAVKEQVEGKEYWFTKALEYS